MTQRTRSTNQPTGLPPTIVTQRVGTATEAAAAGVLGFTRLLAAVGLRRTDTIDLAITLRLQAMRHRSLELLMAAASWPGFRPLGKLDPPSGWRSLPTA